jgi:hypothetical protein
MMLLIMNYVFYHSFSLMGESEDSTYIADLYLETNDLFDE